MRQVAAREEREKQILTLVVAAQAAIITAKDVLAEVRRLLPGGQDEPRPRRAQTP